MKATDLPLGSRKNLRMGGKRYGLVASMDICEDRKRVDNDYVPTGNFGCLAGDKHSQSESPDHS